jgi:hypothetical protein
MSAMPGGSPSNSIGELWPDINELDETGRVGTSATSARSHRENSPSRPSSGRSNREMMEGAALTTRRADNADDGFEASSSIV